MRKLFALAMFVTLFSSVSLNAVIIFFKRLDGKTSFMDVQQNWTVGYIKKLLKNSPEQGKIILCFQGKKLLDDEATVETLNLLKVIK